MAKRIWRTVNSSAALSRQMMNEAEFNGNPDNFKSWVRGRAAYDSAKRVFMELPRASNDPGSGVITDGVAYDLSILRGTSFFEAERTLGHILAEGLRQGFRQPPAEVALLLAQFTQAELGSPFVVVMHEPIVVRIRLDPEWFDVDSATVPYVLTLNENKTEPQLGWIGAESIDSTAPMPAQGFFVFLAPQDAT